MFIDTHAHLDEAAFESDLDEVLERAVRAGVDRIVTIGCVRESLESVARFRALLGHALLSGALGVHPHDAGSWTAGTGEEIAAETGRPEIVAWGEIGLDFHYDNSPRDVQVDVFRRQLKLARECRLPVIIHSREAEELTCRILEEEFSDGPGGVLHCFTGSRAMAERGLELGFCISLGGILTFKRSGELREIAARIPLDRLLIETDAPYLSPVPFRGQRNEPARVVEVAAQLAGIRGLTVEQIAGHTSENFRRLFGS